MPSKIYMLCNSYESGFGHGLANDGMDLSKTPHADPEQGEAYQIGYEAGQEKLRNSWKFHDVEEFYKEDA